MGGWNGDQLFSSASDPTEAANCWCTPRELIGALHERHNFAVDLAALRGSAVVESYFGPDHHDPARRDALAPGVVDQVVADVNAHATTTGRPASVWCNPPYGRGIGAWMGLCRRIGEQVPVVALTFVRTDTRWWWSEVMGWEDGRQVTAAQSVGLFRGRLIFTDAKGEPNRDARGRPLSAPAPSALIFYGPTLSVARVAALALGRPVPAGVQFVPVRL